MGFSARDVNLSRYVGNDATNLIDPYGLEVLRPPVTKPTKPTESPFTGKTPIPTSPPELSPNFNIITVYDGSEPDEKPGDKPHASGEELRKAAELLGNPVNANSVQDLIAAVKAEAELNDPVDLLIIADHSLWMNKRKIGQVIGIELMTPQDAAALAPYLAPGAKIYLGGCQCGISLEYAQEIANATNATVYVSKTSVWWPGGYGVWIPVPPKPDGTAPPIRLTDPFAPLP